MSTLTRRLFMGLSLGAAPFAGNVAQAAPKARRRQVLSLNMRSSEMHGVQVPELSTYMLTLPLETGADAIRVGLANTTPQPYRLAGIACCQAEEWLPKDGKDWAYFSFDTGGSAELRKAAARPMAVTVPGNATAATGAQNVPAVIWSDWIGYETAASSVRPQMLFRTLVPAQELPMAFPAGPGIISPPLPDQPERLIAQACVAGDFVTDPRLQLPETEPTPFSPVYVVQYRTRQGGLQMVIGGDSHFSMSNTFAQMAATQLSKPTAPISVWNAAWAGQPSNTFWPALVDATAFAEPSLTVIQGWTANDGMNPVGDEAYLARVVDSAQRSFAIGAIPVIIKGLPRDLFGKPELQSWQNINRELDGLVPGALVFDPLPHVEDQQRPGNWRAGLSDDGVHPNFWGNFTLRQPFEELIQPLLG